MLIVALGTLATWLRQCSTGRYSSLPGTLFAVGAQCISTTHLPSATAWPHLWCVGNTAVAAHPGTLAVQNNGANIQSGTSCRCHWPARLASSLVTKLSYCRFSKFLQGVDFQTFLLRGVNETTKFGENRAASLLHQTSYFGVDMLICFEMRVAQTRVMSKIDATFLTFWPAVKIMGGVGRTLGRMKLTLRLNLWYKFGA